MDPGDPSTGWMSKPTQQTQASWTMAWSGRPVQGLLPNKGHLSWLFIGSWGYLTKVRRGLRMPHGMPSWGHPAAEHPVVHQSSMLRFLRVEEVSNRL